MYDVKVTSTLLKLQRCNLGFVKKKKIRRKNNGT